MTTYFPIVFEEEDNGTISAYVAGLPVYAAADTQRQAERAIRETLEAYLEAHPRTTPKTAVRVAKVTGRSHVDLVGVAALVGTQTSRAKARASRANGRLGGRPKTVPA